MCKILLILTKRRDFTGTRPISYVGNGRDEDFQ